MLTKSDFTAMDRLKRCDCCLACGVDDPGIAEHRTHKPVETFGGYIVNDYVYFCKECLNNSPDKPDEPQVDAMNGIGDHEREVERDCPKDKEGR